MDYNLNKKQETSTRTALKKMLVFMRDEKRSLLFAFLVMILNAGISMLTPYIIGYTIDHYIQTKEYRGLIDFSVLLFVLYLIWAGTQYAQTQLMGSIGQRMLYALRNEVFNKLQQLPVAFFNQNKSGDLISRINNDTDKVNQFFSQSLMRFVNSIFLMVGAAAFMLSIHVELGAATLVPAVFILLFVLIISPWVKRKNAISLKSSGGLSAQIQESLQNFKTIITFNRRDYFRKRFDLANQDNYKTSIVAGLSNGLFTPVFTLFSELAQLIVLVLGIYLISKGQFTIGLLISFIAYADSFYRPLRQIAALWAGFQTAMAAWDRISVILGLESTLIEKPVKTNLHAIHTPSVIEFKNVSFQYPDGKKVLHHINFNMLAGKTYALVGPTGGGKTTTASLIARLYDPSEGEILLNGIDIRTYKSEERTKLIGFILQEPFLFTGTLRENILYGNELYKNSSNEELIKIIYEAGLSGLLMRFEKGLDTELKATVDSVSLGQKQLIAFIRAVLRRPKILILDEATANIDTVTEKLLEEILNKLPKETTRVIIAHRLNTIENADEIFFVNAGEVTAAGTLDNALDMLLEGKRVS
ncbi:MAG TPA: ABC transporter ATP-binding protein [Arachidicoccus soli]|uniref:ABC transporter ATP-binding protein n=1 Tax=Arachidicoccus soli TaxID=2341117 RepID=A0A386HL91_9BACT|nr:ABC transporter ATP-binding protein [Arachidicoccus soli]AYD46513.1 ABC transporter ATP-binding protein [Arachidicoccus soli]HEU0226887.1 ABC transporter ATP-binding protein [Arachidicoccus soli]